MKTKGVVQICNIEYDIIEADDTEKHELDDCFGYCDNDNLEITIWEGLKPSQERDTMFHEIQHAIWDKGGLCDFVAKELGIERDSTKLRDFEEVFIKLQTPHLIGALASLRASKGKKK